MVSHSAQREPKTAGWQAFLIFRPPIFRPPIFRPPIFRPLLFAPPILRPLLLRLCSCPWRLKASRAPQANGGARPACLSTWPKNAPAFSAFPPSMAVRAASSGRPPFAEEHRSWQHCCHGMQLHRIGDAGAMAFTPGILPYAVRASFAVRAAPAAQWLLSADKSSGTI